MRTVTDFEDMLEELEKHAVRYVIIGGVAFIMHAKPRYTKDIDIWVEPTEENRQRLNLALASFGSPFFYEDGELDKILQIGVEPDRIDFIPHVEGMRFDEAWGKRIRSEYGRVTANWVDLDTLTRIKEGIDDPRHQDDAKVLRDVKEQKRKLGQQVRQENEGA